jgi:hypothetical protein
MEISRKMLCVVYGVIGAVALVGCWGNNLQLFQGLDILGGNIRFWQLTLDNPASRSITVDILCLGLAAILWMLLEARRLSMRFVWLWVLFGLFIAIGAAFPWFLIHRERVLAQRDGGAPAGTLAMADTVGVGLIAIPILAYTVLALTW